MASVLYVGGRLDSVIVHTENVFDWNTGWDGNWSDASLGVGAYGVAQFNFTDSSNNPTSVTAGKTFYFHAVQSWTDGMRGDTPILRFYDSAGKPWINVLNNAFQFQYNSGTGDAPVWTNVGGAFNNYGYNRPVAMDIQLIIGTDGNHKLSFLLDGVLLISKANFNQPAFTNLAYGTFVNENVYNTPHGWSQILVTEGISTVGAHVKTSRPTGPGTYSQWSGAYTDVNEQYTNNTTVNQTTSPDQMQTYAMSDVTLPAGYVMGPIFYYVTAKTDTYSPTNVAAVMRSGGTDFISDALPGVDIGFAGTGIRYDVNPKNGLPWTPEEWNSQVEMGFKSLS